jgi:hypothetical protein
VAAVTECQLPASVGRSLASARAADSDVGDRGGLGPEENPT